MYQTVHTSNKNKLSKNNFVAFEDIEQRKSHIFNPNPSLAVGVVYIASANHSISQCFMDFCRFKVAVSLEIGLGMTELDR